MPSIRVLDMHALRHIEDAFGLPARRSRVRPARDRGAGVASATHAGVRANVDWIANLRRPRPALVIAAWFLWRTPATMSMTFRQGRSSGSHSANLVTRFVGVKVFLRNFVSPEKYAQTSVVAPCLWLSSLVRTPAFLSQA